MFGRKSPESESPSTPRPASAASELFPADHKTLGQLLQEENLITPEQLSEALAEQERNGGFLGQILVSLKFVTQEAVASALVRQCKIPHLNLLDYEISSDVLQLIPREICERHHLLPIDKLGRILTVAMVDPLDLGALEAVRTVCPELRIKPILVNWLHYEQTSKKLYGGDTSSPGKRGSGTGTVTAESLGLRALPPEKPKPQPAPAAPPEPAGTAAQASSTDTKALAALVNQNQALMVNALQAGFKELAASLHAPAAESVAVAAPPPSAYADAIRDALREMLPDIRSGAPAASPAASATDAQALALAMHDSISGAFQEALATVMVKLRAENTAQPTLDQFASVIRQSQADLASSLIEALRPAAGNATPGPAPGAPPPDRMAEMIRDGIAGAMQEALATMVVQLRAAAPKGNDTEALSSALREALASSQESQALTSARLEQIAEAAMQSVQQAALLVEHATTHENQDGSRLARRTSAGSVTPFRGSTDDMLPEPNPDDQRVYDSLESDQPQEALTFERFVSGKANAFTTKLSQAVAAHPGTEYNPFFLYGGVGLGKTHLINAIGNTILRTQQQLRVGYVSASHFARRLRESTERNAADAFRENYCCWDVLILDDIQFLGGKVEAQEEFFHIFNTLHRAGRQIIIASDKAPDKLGLLEKRLVSRFGSGIVAELKPPEWETRVEILRQHARQQKAEVPEEILTLIAMRVPNDIRKMTGSLRKIIAYSNLVGQEMSCEAANEILSHLNSEQAA